MGRFWTPGNALTLLRAALVPAIGVLVYHGGPLGWLFGLIVVAIATDFFDGAVARWTDTVSEWGKALDPTADKLAAAIVTIALMIRPETAGPSLPLWFVAVVLARDAVLAVGGIVQTKRLGRLTTSLWSGKITVAALAFTVLMALLRADADVLALCFQATAVLAAFSTAAYILRYRKIVRGEPFWEQTPGRAPSLPPDPLFDPDLKP